MHHYLLKRKHLWIFFVIEFLVVQVLSGCGSSALPPPVSLSVRDSVFADKGKVVQIYNGSSHHLYNVIVVGRNYREVASASVRAATELKPGQTVEVGWLEFKNWAPQSGETIEVYADNYAAPSLLLIP